MAAYYGAIPVHGYHPYPPCADCEREFYARLAEAWAAGFRAGRDYQDFWRIYEEYGYEPEPEIPTNPYLEK